jgi:uncharacterized protein involved in exopolysaccharide biosynthesis
MMQPSAQTPKEKNGFDPLVLAYPYLPYAVWAAAAALLFTGYTAVKLACSPSLYEATALLKVSDATRPLSSALASGGGAGEDPDVTLHTYVEVARSFSVARRTAQSLDVGAVPVLRKMSREQLAGVLAERVTVKNYKSTSLIQITALAEEPQLAADLANYWSQSFIDEDLSIVRNGAAALHRFLEDQRGKVLEQMLQSQQLLKAHSGGGGGKMVEQGLAAQVNALDQRILQLHDEQATLEARYKPGHPVVKSHKAELERAVEERNKAMTRSGDAAWLQIVHQVKALENTSDWLMQKEQEAIVTENISASNIVVVAPASPPYNPSFPQRRKALVKALLGGFLSGLALAWAALAARRPLQREDDLRQAAGGAPFLGLIPDHRLEVVPRLPPGLALAYDLLRRWKLSLRRGPDRVPSLAPAPQFQGTYFQRCFGEIRNRLLHDPACQRPFCLAIFTPGYQEGRSTTNAGLAVALAQAGKKVLLIDANPWNPAVAGLFKVAPGAGGLADLLAGGTRQPPQPLRTAFPGLHVLPAAAGRSQPPDWVPGWRLREHMAEWKRSYDCILLDPPPLNALSGAENLTDILDGAVLMAASGRTRMRHWKVSMELLQSRRARLLGCLLNRADIRYYSLAHRHFYRYAGLGRMVGTRRKAKAAFRPAEA